MPSYYTRKTVPTVNKAKILMKASWALGALYGATAAIGVPVTLIPVERLGHIGRMAKSKNRRVAEVNIEFKLGLKKSHHDIADAVKVCKVLVSDIKIEDRRDRR